MTSKGKWLVAAAFMLALAAGPLEAAEVRLDNQNRQGAYGVQVIFLNGSGANSLLRCAAAGRKIEAGEPTASVVKIIVFKADKCVDGKTEIPGPALKDYDVPGPLDVKRAFTVTVDRRGDVQITE